jgi:hypothetical protein
MLRCVVIVSTSCWPIVYSVQRVQRRQRVLEDRADFPAADLAHLLVRKVVDAQAVELHLASRDAAGRLEQADHGGAGHRLARPRFADHAEHFTWLDRERDVVDGDERAPARRELDAQVADFEERALAHPVTSSVRQA